MERIVGLMRKMVDLHRNVIESYKMKVEEENRLKDEIRKAFIDEFGIKPTLVTPDMAMRDVYLRSGDIVGANVMLPPDLGDELSMLFNAIWHGNPYHDKRSYFTVKLEVQRRDKEGNAHDWAPVWNASTRTVMIVKRDDRYVYTVSLEGAR